MGIFIAFGLNVYRIFVTFSAGVEGVGGFDHRLAVGLVVLKSGIEGSLTTAVGRRFAIVG